MRKIRFIFCETPAGNTYRLYWPDGMAQPTCAGQATRYAYIDAAAARGGTTSILAMNDRVLMVHHLPSRLPDWVRIIGRWHTVPQQARSGTRTAIVNGNLVADVPVLDLIAAPKQAADELTTSAWTRPLIMGGLIALALGALAWAVKTYRHHTPLNPFK